MSFSPFRFLHSSDWRLEQPAGGGAIPDVLRQTLIDAPFRAAQKVVDLALQERVDFVVLAGEIMHLAETGPRGLLFITEQFQRLAERGVEVYWAGGQSDPPEDWPSAIRLPANVHRFPTDRVTPLAHRRGSDVTASLLGMSGSGQRKLRAADFVRERTDVPTIAVACGQVDVDDLSHSSVAYWALGGDPRRQTIMQSPAPAHYPGSPQARRPGENGPHGCTLVQVDDAQQIRTSMLQTDVLRYVVERVVAPANGDRETLEKLLVDRARALHPGELGPDLMVSWVIAGPDSALAPLRRGGLANELLSRLRAEMQGRRPALWSVSLTPQTPTEFPEEVYAQDTLLGEFLRTVRQYESDARLPLDIEPFLAERHRQTTLASALEMKDPPKRAAALQEAARLGARLFSGEETMS